MFSTVDCVVSPLCITTTANPRRRNERKNLSMFRNILRRFVSINTAETNTSIDPQYINWKLQLGNGEPALGWIVEVELTRGCLHCKIFDGCIEEVSIVLWAK